MVGTITELILCLPNKPIEELRVSTAVGVKRA